MTIAQIDISLQDAVTVKCPVYRRGRKFRGIVTGINPLTGQLKVKIEGNTKSTVFAACWCTKTNS